MEYRWIRTGMVNLQCSNFQTCLVVLGSFGRGRAGKLGIRGLCVSSGALLRCSCVGEEADRTAASEKKHRAACHRIREEEEPRRCGVRTTTESRLNHHWRRGGGSGHAAAGREEDGRLSPKERRRATLPPQDRAAKGEVHRCRHGRREIASASCWRVSKEKKRWCAASSAS